MIDRTETRIDERAQTVPDSTALSSTGRRRRGWPVVLAILALIALAVLYLAPRLIDIDRMVVVDEALWLGRSTNFVYGLWHVHPMETYQFAHPGVTTMWAGAIAMLVMELPFVEHHNAAINGVVNVHTTLRAYGIDPLDMLVYARVTKVLGQAICFVIAIWFVARIFGRNVAAIAALLIAFDPFLIGHDRLLHIDGLLAITTFAALLTFIRAREMRTNPWLWMLCGVFFTLACLTRSVGALLLPIFALVMLGPTCFALFRRRLGIEDAWRQVKIPVLGFGVSAIVSAWALWPALLWAPGIVATQMLQFSVSAVEEGHELPIFFNGKVVSGDPGWIFYPESMLWRMTPVTIAGVALLLLLLPFRGSRVLPPGYRFPIALLGSYALLFIGGMSLADKKFDRYVLPVYPIAELFAAIAFAAVGRLLWSRRNTVLRLAAVLVIVLAVGVQAQAAYGDRRYGLDYYDPVLGGMKNADDAMLIGWGEGLDQAADYIESQPDGQYAVVRTSTNRVSLLYFLPATADVEAGGLTTNAAGIANWAATDYYVSYTLQWQRDLTQTVLNQLATYQPVHVVSINGVEMARVYKLEDIPPPAKMVDTLACTWSYGNQVRLLTFGDALNPVPAAAQNTTKTITDILKGIARTDQTPAPTPTHAPTPSPTLAPSSGAVVTVPTPTPTVAPTTPPTPTPAASSDNGAPGVMPGRVVGPAAPSTSHIVTLVFATGNAYTGNGAFGVKLALVPKAGLQNPITQTATFVPSTVPGALREVKMSVDIPANRQLNSYWMEVTVTNPATGATLPVSVLRGDGTPLNRDTDYVNACTPVTPAG